MHRSTVIDGSSIVAPSAEPGAYCVLDPRLHVVSIDTSALISRRAIKGAVRRAGNDSPPVEGRATRITVAHPHRIEVEARPVFVQQSTEGVATDPSEPVKVLRGYF